MKKSLNYIIVESRFERKQADNEVDQLYDVDERNSNLGILVARVNDHIKRGYVPVGSVFSAVDNNNGYTVFFQPMIKSRKFKPKPKEKI